MKCIDNMSQLQRTATFGGGGISAIIIALIVTFGVDFAPEVTADVLKNEIDDAMQLHEVKSEGIIEQFTTMNLKLDKIILQNQVTNDYFCYYHPETCKP